MRASALILIAFNLIPLAGVLALGWSVYEIIALYWAENVVIGALAIVRILTAVGGEDRRSGLAGRIVTAAFFTVHYGLFTFVHGVFVVSMFGEGAEPESFVTPLSDGIWEGGMVVALAGLALSHTLSLAINWFGRGERSRASHGSTIAQPYARVIILHVVIMIGGLLVQALGAPVLAIAMLVGVKSVVDLAAHLREHARADAPPVERGARADVMSAG